MNPVQAHFSQRAGHYDRSSRWCTDEGLGVATEKAVGAGPHDRLLDIACGTGLVSKRFKGKAKEVVGLDLTPAMFEHARPHVDRLVEGDATALPFADATFDRVVCRQGIQFMDDGAAVREMVRVLRPRGRVVLIHLCAYGDDDREEYFEVLRLRNPARRNFYVRDDLRRLLADAGCARVDLTDFTIDEDVGAWADNKAIDDARQNALLAVYRGASAAFASRHAVRTEGDRVIDRMLFCIATGFV